MGLTAENSQAGTPFIPVSAVTLTPEVPLGISLYLPESKSGKMRLYCAPDLSLTQIDINKLLSRGRTKLYIREAERDHYQRYLRDSLHSILEDESVPVTRRFACLNEVVRDVLANSFASEQTDDTVNTCRGLAQNTVELICRRDIVETDLMGIMHHDYHTFTHSANVSYYSVMLAKALQLADEQQLTDIATAGLLHDLGKLEIPENILCKPGRLSDEEFSVIRRHPRTGFRKLCHRQDLSYGQLMMVYQHHERLDGRGYPVGITAELIHPWARVCTVVDVFEALTSHRPYRTGMSYSQAFEIMDRDCGRAFDEEMLRCWKATIQQK